MADRADEREKQQEQQERNTLEHHVTVWKSKPEKHGVIIGSGILTAAMLVLGVWLVWGTLAASVIAVLILVLAGVIHYLLQQHFRMEQAILYRDNNELFLIMLDKSDKELKKYLNGELDIDLTGKKPGDIIVELAEWSVICYIADVHSINESKEQVYAMFIKYDLLPYKLRKDMLFMIKRSRYENFDELVEFLYYKLGKEESKAYA